MTSTKMTIAAKKQWIVGKLDESPKNVERAVIAIFKRQTADEQRTNSTSNDNAMGFNGLDAEFGSSLAKAITKYGKLTPNQAPHARRIIGKYWKQLIEVATVKGNAPWCEAKVVAVIDCEPTQSPSRCIDEEGHDGEDCTCNNQFFGPYFKNGPSGYMMVNPDEN